jgi:hypothetical protein
LFRTRSRPAHRSEDPGGPARANAIAVAARQPRIARWRPFSAAAPVGAALGDNAGRFRRQTAPLPSDPTLALPAVRVAPRPFAAPPERAWR